ncbi:hypothetical protein BC793_10691 [Actinoplanes xinjiangensis]|uniref:Uncharacterized protein n=1 Tax=Actinoplanes xinjiangensis TaxID=512350 RepID=A0A316FGY0_9ACTN|nr:hypothetical protein BC793_10691 [Actinoplanes xinjiangensis]GIF39185.1 hypothetical protein Axi01nite_34960 [Actinoplanes xinjiangensis]
MRWPVTEPPESSVPRWLPSAAAIAVGVAGIAAMAAVVVCRRQAVAGEPALPEEPPPLPAPPRLLVSLLGTLSAEKPGPSVPAPRPAASRLPPEDPQSRRSHVIGLAIAAVVVWAWVAAYLYGAMSGPTYEPRPSPEIGVAPGYRIEPRGFDADRY